jgi:2-methylisocitrate lyase-like PEP mutase family enzyme
MPDAGLQSFGEYRDAVARIMEGSSLLLIVDGENGFGEPHAPVMMLGEKLSAMILE